MQTILVHSPTFYCRQFKIHLFYKHCIHFIKTGMFHRTSLISTTDHVISRYFMFSKRSGMLNSIYNKFYSMFLVLWTKCFKQVISTIKVWLKKYVPFFYPVPHTPATPFSFQHPYLGQLLRSFQTVLA